MSDLGFITIALGKPAYAEFAVDLALSARAFHDLPFALVADAGLKSYVEARYPGVFDVICLLPDGFQKGDACKFALAEVTPFKRTVFIDADTLVLAPLNTLLREAEAADVLMIGAYRDHSTDQVHHGFSVRGLMKRYGLERYFDNHSGAFAFEIEQGRAFLRAGADIYLREMADLQRWSRFRRIGDELAFGIAGARRRVAIMSEPFPIYWSNELAALTSDNRWKPLCHFHDSPAPAALDWLMREVAERRAARGFPALSEPAWRAKAKKCRQGYARGEWLLSLYRKALRATASRNRRRG
jgi:hypothetical protein